jgi:magnesium transporter
VENVFTFTQLNNLPLRLARGPSVGRIRDLLLDPSHDPYLIEAIVVRREGRLWRLPAQFEDVTVGGLRLTEYASQTQPFESDGNELLAVRRDVLDQQIIDVNGRKVVRVNDVDFEMCSRNGYFVLRALRVDVGISGAFRRLTEGLVPRAWLARASRWMAGRTIPWNAFNLIETDPARRVKLQIGYEALARLHPADVADIVEELAPDQREAVFESLESEIAADILGEIEPRFQRSILQSLDSDKAADIVEEMDPDEAADILADLPQKKSEEILKDMQPEDRDEVSDLLEFREDSAGGRMTTDMITLSTGATVAQAIEALRTFEGPVEAVNTIFLVDEEGRLFAPVPLTRVLLASSDTPLADLRVEPVAVTEDERDTAVAEKFDKYNLLTLPVVDAERRLKGVITADDVISMLRGR